jgi:hypothetical protein
MILLNKYQNSFYNGRFLLKIELITCISAKKFWILSKKWKLWITDLTKFKVFVIFDHAFTCLSWWIARSIHTCDRLIF